MADNQSALSYGGDLMIFLVPTTGTTKQPLAFSTSAKLSVSNKSRDVSSKDSGDWPSREYGRFDWNMSTDQLFAMTLTGSTLTGSTYGADTIFAMYVAKQKVNVAFASKTGTTPSWTINSAKKSFTGQAVISSFDINSADGDNSTYSISLDGDSPLVLA